MSNEEASRLVAEEMNKPAPKSELSWKLRKLILRGCGITMLYVCFQVTSITLTQSNISKLYAMVFGAIVLVMGFMGLVMTFGKYTKSAKKGFDMSINTGIEDQPEITPADVTEAWSRGFDEGYDTALQDLEEEEMTTTPADSGKVPADRAPDEIGPCCSGDICHGECRADRDQLVAQKEEERESRD